MSEPEKKKRAESTYLVQMRKSVAGAQDWTDIDFVTVPAGTKRRTVLDKVRDMDLGLQVGESAMVRVIPEEHATMDPVSMVQPAPQMKVGA
jgi:hypothetical protein